MPQHNGFVVKATACFFSVKDFFFERAQQKDCPVTARRMPGVLWLRESFPGGHGNNKRLKKHACASLPGFLHRKIPA